MKYIAVLDTDEIEDFAFFEDGKEKYLHGIDANSVNGEWIYLPFKPLEQKPTEKCTWIKYDYRTMCPKEHDVDNPYWRIPEKRMETLKYCPYCGKEIEVEE